jgi:effector-binding domain-containing protein
LALRDLGFGLEQIGALLDDDLSVEELPGMLRLRRAQIEQSLADEHARLRRVEAHLRALEGRNAMSTQNVVVKKTQPLRIAEAFGTAAALGPQHVGPVFMELMPELMGHLDRAGARAGMVVGYYDDPAEDGSVGVHVGVDIGDQAVESDGRVKVVDLPVVEVASLLHRGPMDNVEEDYEALIRWIDDSGYPSPRSAASSISSGTTTTTRRTSRS